MERQELALRRMQRTSAAHGLWKSPRSAESSQYRLEHSRPGPAILVRWVRAASDKAHAAESKTGRTAGTNRGNARLSRRHLLTLRTERAAAAILASESAGLGVRVQPAGLSEMFAISTKGSRMIKLELSLGEVWKALGDVDNYVEPFADRFEETPDE